MAIFTMKLEPGVKGADIRRKLAAFTELYGDAWITLRGDVPTLHKGQILPAFVAGATVNKIGNATLEITISKSEGDAVVRLDALYTMRPQLPASRVPEIQFMSKRA